MVPRGDATAFVTAVLQDVGRDVTRLSSSCYAMFLEYSYRVMKPRGQATLGSANKEIDADERKPLTFQEAPWTACWRIRLKSGVGSLAGVRLVTGLGTAIVAASKLAVTDPTLEGSAILPSALH